jgi:hypothetical protein
MTITVAQFRADFPEFTDTTKYPDTMVTFWLTQAGKLLRPDRWVDELDLGTELFVAHQLVIGARNQKNGGSGAGASIAPISSKTVDKVSVSYDTGSVTMTDAGFWNATNYGQRFWWLLQMAGAGAVQLY